MRLYLYPGLQYKIYGPLITTIGVNPTFRYQHYTLIPLPAAACIKLLEPYAKMIRVGHIRAGLSGGWVQAGESWGRAADHWSN
jgi:hypothetical protein